MKKIDKKAKIHVKIITLVMVALYLLWAFVSWDILWVSDIHKWMCHERLFFFAYMTLIPYGASLLCSINAENI